MSCFRWSMGEISSHGIECLPASSVARSVTHVPGLFCYPCPWTAPPRGLTNEWSRRALARDRARLIRNVRQRKRQMADILMPSEQLAYSTVRIECQLADGTVGTGTGFFFRFLDDADRHVPAIVTNKHVIVGAQQGRFHLTVADESG